MEGVALCFTGRCNYRFNIVMSELGQRLCLGLLTYRAGSDFLSLFCRCRLLCDDPFTPLVPESCSPDTLGLFLESCVLKLSAESILASFFAGRSFDYFGCSLYFLLFSMRSIAFTDAFCRNCAVVIRPCIGRLTPVVTERFKYIDIF